MAPLFFGCTTVNPTIELAQDLIRIHSITPEDGGCQDILCDRLAALGFEIHRLNKEGVSNFWAEQPGEGPLLCFAGHTDVVPTGDLTRWHHPPFAAELDEQFLHGRGAADMKGSLAAMTVAAEQFVAQQSSPSGRLAFLITSDEEGPAQHGTRHVMQWLGETGRTINWCVIGEPSSTSSLGDIVKNGRRGSLNVFLTLNGKQGHVAYPHKALNPVHAALAALDQLVNTEWDTGNEFFPATTFQISNLRSGTGATNVIPGDLEVVFNFRFSTETSAQELQARVESILETTGLDYQADWQLSGNPFLTEPGELTQAVCDSVKEVTTTSPELSTTGGTSDGRFIAPAGIPVVELGPLNDTIHKLDEKVSIDDLIQLTEIYQKIMQRLVG